MVEQDVSQIALLEHEAQHPPQIGAELIDRGCLIGSYFQAHNPGRKFRDHLLEQFLEEVFLVLEIEIEGAACDASACDNVRDIGAMIALAREDSLRVAQDLGASFGTFHSAGWEIIGPSANCTIRGPDRSVDCAQ